MILDELITDRTRADVERVRRLIAKGYAAMTETERAELASNLKGAYNASDLNRVGSAANYVRVRLRFYLKRLLTAQISNAIAPDTLFSLPYTLSDIDIAPKTDWEETDIPTESQMSAYLRDVRTLRGLLPLPDDLAPLPESMSALDYAGANAIEATLLAVADAGRAAYDKCVDNINLAAASAWQCAEIGCGEGA